MNVRREHGLIGKALVVWLLVTAIIGVGILDFVSIATTRFHISDLASQAAQDGANAYREARTAPTEKIACDAAKASLKTADPAIKLTKCSVDATTKEITVTVRKTASTIAADRIGFLQKFTNVEDTETVGPSTL
jgi:hypothetical protein